MVKNNEQSISIFFSEGEMEADVYKLLLQFSEAKMINHTKAENEWIKEKNDKKKEKKRKKKSNKKNICSLSCGVMMSDSRWKSVGKSGFGIKKHVV